MFTLKNAHTDPLFLNESGSALNRATYLFHILGLKRIIGKPYFSDQFKKIVFLFLLLYVPSQQLWSLRDGQFT